jgi:hypothetical protein
MSTAAIAAAKAHATTATIAIQRGLFLMTILLTLWAPSWNPAP